MVDLDDLLSYKTVRLAKIRNRFLGTVHYAFMLVIFLYIVIYKIWMLRGYMLQHDIVGAVRMQTKSNFSQKDYPRNVSELSYCTNKYSTVCEFLSAGLVVYPVVEATAVTLTSRLTYEYFERPNGCATISQEPRCADWNKTHEVSTYPVGIERMTIYFDHNVYSSGAGLTGNSNQMYGQLVDRKGKRVNPCDDYPKGECPSFVGFGGIELDIVPLATLLRAADVDLDKPNWHDGESARHSGLVLVMQIEYGNYGNSVSNITYLASVEAIPDAEFKVEETLDTSDTTRTVFDRHGVRVVVSQTGTLGTIDIFTCILNLTASIGLIAVATTITDYMMQYLLTQAEEFTGLKYSTSRDFFVDDHDDDADRFNEFQGQECNVIWRVGKTRQDFFAMAEDTTGNIHYIPLNNLDSTGVVKKFEVTNTDNSISNHGVTIQNPLSTASFNKPSYSTL